MQFNASVGTRVLPWTKEIRFDGSGSERMMGVAGYGSSAETLRDHGREISEKLSATVLLMTLPGHTEKQFFRRRPPQYFFEIERRFLSFWRERETPVHLVGYSSGGYFSTFLAVRHPAKVASVTIASTPLRMKKQTHQLLGWTVAAGYYLALPVGLASALGAVWWRKRSWPVKHRTLASVGAVGGFLGALAVLRRAQIPLSSTAEIERDGEVLVTPHFSRASAVSAATLIPLGLATRWALKLIKLPVCIVYGEHDHVVDYGIARLVATGRGERTTHFHILPEAPHRVVTEPDFHRIVLEFLDTTGRAARMRDTAEFPEVDPPTEVTEEGVADGFDGQIHWERIQWN